LLRSLVANLVGNAIAYNHPGGSVAVTVARTLDRAELLVTNTGRELTADEVHGLVHPFVRAEVERQRVAGSGIGMAVVAAVAAAHNGTFEVEPRVGGGLSARVRIPIDRSLV
jgi:two-component system, OmpR family, sensor histidine kinase VanS